MEFKKAIKRVVALGVGASMVGATMLSALAAADLSTYPSPFVKDGTFNALIVVGESAATQDVLGAIDIATSLQYASKTIKAVEGGTTVSVEGDAYRIDKSSDFVEIGENVSGVLNAGTPSVGKNELAGLAGGTVRNNKGSYDYNEYVDLPLSASVQFVRDPDDDTDTPAFYMKLVSGKQAYRYSVEFPVALEADVGTTPSTGISQLQNKKITLVGDEYTITSAKLSGLNDITLELMGGAIQDVLEEGTSKTYTLNGKDYEVSADYIGGAGTTTSPYVAKFTINGEVTDSLEESESYKTIDGVEIGVRDIMTAQYAGEASGGDKVEFFLGAKKLKIVDNTYDDTTASGEPIIVGGNTIDDVTGSVYGSNTTTTLKINSLKFQWLTSEDKYVPVDGKLSQKQDEVGELPFNFDFEFKGMTVPATEEILFNPRGDNRYTIDFTNKAGDSISLPFIDADYDNAGSVKFGEGDKTLWLCEPMTIVNATNQTFNPSNFTIKKNDYFVITAGVPPSKNLNTYLIQYKGFVNTSGAEKVTFKNIGSGESFDVTNLVGNTNSVTWANTSATAHGQIKVGTDAWNFWLKENYRDANITVDLDQSGGVVADANPKIFTKYGGYFSVMAGCNASAILQKDMSTWSGPVSLLNFTSGDNKNTVVERDQSVGVALTFATNQKVDISSVGPTLTTIGDSDNKEGYAIWGTHLFQQVDTSGPDKLTLTYPKEQVEALVYVTTGATTSATALAGGVETQVVNRIDVGAAVLDTDPAVDGKEKTKNLIVVGGPAINKAAAVLLGKPFPSYGAASGIPENAGLIKLVENEPYVALVVAGWEAMESQMAARVIADYEKYQEDGTLKGTEVEVAGTSLTDITVSVPTPVVEEEAPAAEEETV